MPQSRFERPGDQGWHSGACGADCQLGFQLAGRIPRSISFSTPHRITARWRVVSWEEFGGTDVPFLSCLDIAVFKAFFDRTKDWADLEEMQAAGTLEISRVSAILIEYFGVDDPRIRKLAALRAR